MKKSTSITRGFLPTSLVVLFLLVLAGDFPPASGADDQPADVSAMQRRLARIGRKLDYIENRLLADDSVAVMAPAMSAQNAALAAAVIDPPWLPSEPLKGRIVFEQKNCNRCHAISGTGGSTGPDLVKTLFQGSFLDLASILWNHIPDMLVEYKTQKLILPTYTEEEVADLISYLYYLRYLGTPGDVARGEKLLEEKSCVKCHTTGQNNDLGPGFDRIKKYASPLELAQALWNHEPKMHDMMRRLGIPRPTFTGQEISDLSAYVRAASRWAQTERIYVSPGSPQDGAKVYEQKGCADCHTRGGSTAPLLVNLPLHKSASDIAGMMWNHGNEMFEEMQARAVVWPIFEGKEMADLIAYLYFVKFIEPPGNAVVGKTCFQEKKCSACHSIQGVGGSLGPDLALSTSHGSSIAILAAMLSHSETMSEAVLNKGASWPLLNGKEMRDIFAYIKAVSGIKRATVQAALGPQPSDGPSLISSNQPSPAQPGFVPQTLSRLSRATTDPPPHVVDSELARVRDLPTIPHGYQVVDALFDTPSGSGLVQMLKNSLGEEQMERVKISFHHSPEFISKADFTWTPRNLKGARQIHVFVPTLFQAGLTLRLDGETVWNPTDRNGRNILSPQIDLELEEPKLNITVDDRSEKDGIHGGVDDIYILRPTTN